MKFGAIIDVKKAEVREHEIPEIGSNEVLIRNKTCNICTTDYQQWQGLRPHQKMNMAFGHENAGIVEAVGADVKNVKVGDHVVSNAYHPCLECANCRKGMPATFCLNPSDYFNIQSPQGYYGFYGCSEYQVAQSKHVFTVNPDIPYEYANFCEPTATVVRGIRRLDVRPGQRVLVIGAGTMGILNAQVARYYGADVIVSELTEKKLAVAESLGFATINAGKDDLKAKIDEFSGGLGVDSIVIAVGATAAYNQAIEVSKIGGKLLIFASGYPKPDWNLDPNLVHYKLLDVIGTYGCSPEDYQIAAELISNSKIDVSKIIEKMLPLENIQEAFEAAATKDAYRVIVTI